MDPLTISWKVIGYLMILNLKSYLENVLKRIAVQRINWFSFTEIVNKILKEISLYTNKK